MAAQGVSAMHHCDSDPSLEAPPPSPMNPPMSPRVHVHSGERGITQLLDRNRAWADSMLEKDPDFFTRLASQHSPEILWIGCSDSRVPANEILALSPGEVFVHRNIANQVSTFTIVCAHRLLVTLMSRTHPRVSLVSTDMNCLSVIEYAVKYLQVRHIIVCGHYGCGGVHAALSQDEFGLVDNWLRSIKDLYIENHKKFGHITDTTTKADLLTEENVARSVYNVCHSRIVQNAWENGQTLSVHGLCYRLQDGIIRDLQICISGEDQVEAIYRRMMTKSKPEL
ncbi:hypothetical protein H310_02732 [Aphanomyces invadans]|uniref:Carbonic anhydrase n=1 Tax=Aphanomyces invadans TaxID=157072 RepID=A0A024UKW7_9STRA|nr:hypothetical protein H310_02732 [Aphanomyces invadans]ETW06487.1 hypothetical protein H310_02732 [Aphanomyces invadans]|eukprot:XP_008864562.1 hypothetical protein H310_02732 [Aphanomyces invadans]